MHRMGTTILLAALAALVLAMPASANYRVGISEQDARTFDQPLWQNLGLKRVRYIVPWDYYKGDGAAEAASFLNAARAKNQDVLVMFTARRGCYSNGKYSKSSACRAPSKAAYTTAFKKFKAAFPWVKTYAPWNEANHVSQPIAKNPKRAADYYAALRANCKGCKILGRRRARPEHGHELAEALHPLLEEQGPRLGPAQLQGRQPQAVQRA